jgi:hypothetical protein
MDPGSTSAGESLSGGVARRIVVHAALLDGVPRLFALSAKQARMAIDELATLDESVAPLPSDLGTGDTSIGWRIVEQEVDVFPVPVEIVSGAEGAELCWTCPACGMAWSDPWSDEDELPVLLLCDCGGTANTWCLGTIG